MKVALHIVAERQGFEPWVPLQVQRISNPSRSTTPAPLQTIAIYISGTYLILATESCSEDLELSTHGNRMKYRQIRNVYPNVSKLKCT